MLRSGLPTRRCHVAIPQEQTAGLDRARRPRVDTDILRSMVYRHGFGELDNCSFRGAISRTVRGGDAAQLGSDVNNATAAGGNHARQNRPTHEERTGYVYGEYPRPLLRRNIENRAIAVVGCCSIDQNVDGPEPRNRGGCVIPCCSFIAHVAAQRQCFGTAGGNGLFG